MANECTCGCDHGGDMPVQYECDCGGCDCGTIVGFQEVPDVEPHCCGKPMKRVK